MIEMISDASHDLILSALYYFYWCHFCRNFCGL